MAVTRVEQSDVSFTFTGAGWTLLTIAGASGGNLQYTDGDGDYVEIAYSGYGCGLIFTTSTSGGPFDIYLDGVWKMQSTTLTAAWSGEGVTYPSNIIWQLPIYIPSDVNDDHTLRVVRRSGTLYIDAIDIVTALDAPTADKILGFGDSWTAGSQASGASERFINQVQTDLGIGTLVNAGISGNEICGWQSNYGYWRCITDVIGATPTYLVIALGFNDCRRGTSVAVYDRFYDAVLRMITARLDTSGMTIICCTPGHSTTAGLTRYPPYDAATVKRFLLYGSVVRNRANEWGYITAEIYGAMNQTDALMDADDVHPNDIGHDIVSGEVLRAIIAGGYGALFESAIPSVAMA